ncbi:MAG: hypothetical protein HOH95_03150 [Dehalococcoidia bacterium]|nr:hypothetical protein [Dehalococcoidia bacterium]
MNIASRVLTWFVVLSVGAAVVAGGFLGVRTAQHASEPAVAELTIADPELFSGPPAGAFNSPGGFSGFGSTSLRGQVLGSGELVSVQLEEQEDEAASARGTLIIRNGSRELTVRFLSTLRLYQIASIDQLAADDLVVIRSADGDVTGLLRVPVDAEAEPAP